MLKQKQSTSLGLGLILALIYPSSVLADAKDVLNFNFGYSATYDDNLFRLDSGQRPSASTYGSSKRGELITSTTYGVSLNKYYGLQQFKADVTQINYNYKNFGFLDFEGTNYDLQWRWSVTPFLTGAFIFDRQQRPNTFSDIRNINPLTTNTTTVKNNRAEIDFSPYNSWHVYASIGELSVVADNSAPGQDVIDFTFDQTSLRSGVRYIFANGTIFDYAHTKSNGENQASFFNPTLVTDRGYEETRDDFLMGWSITGKSRVDAVATYLSRKNDTFSQRDVDGWMGNVNYQWDITGKTGVAFYLGSVIYPTQSTGNSYLRENMFAIRPSWSITSKTRLSGELAFKDRKYGGFAPFPTAEQREDSIQSGSISLSWAPRRFVTFQMALRRELRDSNFANFDYTTNSATLSASLLF
ncbi:XrtB/PEP-CTERM-associated polysaccharide biosynthesis outer membrane protein EpsL [Methylovorus sp. MP688]|uniref:XrtB/PEP-CTERM-associated polysaccharide biosynthesis outer membrane protein EpsL n=1 Tax=Methylovorus sp. (strain MP688) TaxID=887061 RepID=UPI001439D7FC|nr:XrtB/PEP-CTERM-associated polysaccharide biosynthesis outer membrane protein EpsL [Methylovorus sp. MP688]